ncbi:energy-coupling factor transporter transmembrane component T family protein [Coprothermobacter platensis]|uniref:energy-coupling factor transporter transmembrane component T family protein n=1 Tax=Coprothermobacter platensis TaxID=108819 RepID=UPI00036D2646|nr:energy-coupling factor transporter transmembrane component T [Coprothermobacter platensis]
MAFKDVVVVGQYIPSGSILHKARAESKIIMTLILIIAAFLSQSFAVMAVLFTVLAFLMVVSRVPLRFYSRSARAVLILVLFTFVFNALLTGQNVLFRIGPIAFKTEGTITGVFFGLRLFFLIFVSTVLTATTSPVDLADGLNTLLKPLEAIKVPVEEFSLIMTIALRFIPVLADEADRILKAQKARGLNLTGNLFEKVQKLVPIIIPLFVSAFMKAEDLAVAMEVRGYLPGVKRTKYKVAKFAATDLGILAASAIILCACIYLRGYWLVTW